MRGVDFVIEINTGTEATPIWKKVAGQRGGKLNREFNEIDTGSKDGSGWNDNDYGLGSWGIEADGLLSENDEGIDALEDAFMNKEFVQVQLKNASGKKYTGLAMISDFPIDAPHDDLVTYSVKLTGKGPLTITPGT